LGLGSYDQAFEWMTEAAKLDVKNWMVETTARQIARLVRMEVKRNRPQVGEKSPRQVLEAFMRSDQEETEYFVRGKFGLALSGGGFRASLFHIGVLARLAEMDLLRHVEVISCVSGGSILGAYYYLELQQLLQSTPEPTHLDYMRLGLPSNLRLALRESSTTYRLGHLYEKKLFALVQDGKASAHRYTDQLKV